MDIPTYMKDVFLSASIPDPKRDPRFAKTGDVIAIRDSVIALARYVLPRARLVWGGHPAITPLIRIVAGDLKVNVKEHVALYQSKFYSKKFPIDNEAFEESLTRTPKGESEDSSKRIMRERMLSEHQFIAGIFIGGMEGVLEEFDMFSYRHSSAKLIPVASTGAAARILFDEHRAAYDLPENLLTEIAYESLFRNVLRDLNDSSV